MISFKYVMAATVLLTAVTSQAKPTYSISIEIPEAKPFKKRPHILRGRVIPDQLWNNPVAATMWGEARNQPEDGMRAVGHVVKNRAKAHRKAWGLTTRQVAFKRKQFSWLSNNDPGLDNFKRMLSKPKDHPERILWERIKYLSDHLGNDNSGGATSYATNDCNMYWKYSMTVIGVMFDHTFFRPKTAAEWKTYYRDKHANERLMKARRIAHKANRKKPRKVSMEITHRVKIRSHNR